MAKNINPASRPSCSSYPPVTWHEDARTRSLLFAVAFERVGTVSFSDVFVVRQAAALPDANSRAQATTTPQETSQVHCARGAVISSAYRGVAGRGVVFVVVAWRRVRQPARIWRRKTRQRRANARRTAPRQRKWPASERARAASKKTAGMNTRAGAVASRPSRTSPSPRLLRIASPHARSAATTPSIEARRGRREEDCDVGLHLPRQHRAGRASAPRRAPPPAIWSSVARVSTPRCTSIRAARPPFRPCGSPVPLAPSVATVCSCERHGR